MSTSTVTRLERHFAFKRGGIEMIGSVLAFLRTTLDEHLRAELGGADPIGDKVVFIDGDKMDPLALKLDAVSLLVINVEEERLLRRADPYLHAAADGSPQRGQPDVRLMLYLLFAARFKQYDAAWEHLSKIVEYLQSHPVFDATSQPSAPENVEKLSLELVTLRFSEQNEIWGALKTTQHPALLYRAKLIVVRDKQAVAVGEVTERVVHIRQPS